MYVKRLCDRTLHQGPKAGQGSLAGDVCVHVCACVHACLVYVSLRGAACARCSTPISYDSKQQLVCYGLCLSATITCSLLPQALPFNLHRLQACTCLAPSPQAPHSSNPSVQVVVVVDPPTRVSQNHACIAQVVVLAVPGREGAAHLDPVGLAAMAVLRSLGLPSLVAVAVVDGAASLKDRAQAKKAVGAALTAEVRVVGTSRTCLLSVSCT